MVLTTLLCVGLIACVADEPTHHEHAKTMFDHLVPESDGSYAAPGRSIAATAWMILAMLGEGHTTTTGRESAHLAHAVSWLAAQQEHDGSFGDRDDPDFSVDSAAACLALVEACLSDRAEGTDIDIEPIVVRAVQAVGLSIDVKEVPRQFSIAAIIERILHRASIGGGLESAAAFLRSRMTLSQVRVGDPQAESVLERLQLLAGGDPDPGGPDPGVPWPTVPEQDPLGTLLVTLSCYQPRSKPWHDQAGATLSKLWDDVETNNTWAPLGRDRSLGRIGVSAVNWISVELYLEFCRLRTAALFEEVNAAR